MTRKLESLFNLPPADVFGQPTSEVDDQTLIDKGKESIAETQRQLAVVDDAIDKIDLALPTLRDLDASDAEMDELADLAKTTFTELIYLSMNVEPRFSGPILQSASTLLGHAITAKMAKMDKKLKMVDLQLKKAKLDQNMLTKPTGESAVEGKGTVVDRNDLLRELIAMSKVKN